MCSTPMRSTLRGNIQRRADRLRRGAAHCARRSVIMRWKRVRNSSSASRTWCCGRLHRRRCAIARRARVPRGASDGDALRPEPGRRCRRDCLCGARPRRRSATWRRPSRTCSIVLAIAERHASPFDWIFACIAAGEVNELAGRLEEAAVWFDRALYLEPIGQHAADAGDRRQPSGAGRGAARARWLRAWHDCGRPSRISERMGFRNELPFCLAALAEATLAVGRRRCGDRDWPSDPAAWERRIERSYRHGSGAAGAGALPCAKAGASRRRGRASVPRWKSPRRTTWLVRRAMPRSAGCPAATKGRIDPRDDPARQGIGNLMPRNPPVHIALIDTTGPIRFSRMQKVAAAIEHQVRHDLGKFYDVECTYHRAAARRGAAEPDLAGADRAGGEEGWRFSLRRGWRALRQGVHRTALDDVGQSRDPRDGVRSHRQPAAYGARHSPGRRSGARTQRASSAI